MSINLNPNAATSSSSEILSRSLNRLASQTSTPALADELTVSGKFDAQRQEAQADLAEVQNAATAAQSSDAFLAHVGDLLSQMSALAQKSDAANFQPQFKALQDQLQATIGTAAPAGGTPASVQSLVAEDDAGNYQLTISSSDLTSSLATATQDVDGGRAGLAAGLAKLHHRAASLQIESANLNATVGSVQTLDDANAATQLAKFALSTQPGSALSAQGAGRAPGSAFKLLQD